jgi:TRAP transporter TAXI family solute receptor
MDRCASVNRAVLMAFCGLFIATPIWAEPQDEQFQDEQFREDQSQIARPKHKPKPVVHRVDPAIQLRHNLRDKINSGLVSIVSEGTDETVDMALALTAQAEHDRLRVLPIAGAGASQNAEDVMLTRGIDFGIVQTDVLDEIRRNPPFPGVEKYLQYITKLYDRQVHILAGPDIQSIDDLTGKKVNFGLRDSGTYATATAIFKVLGVEPDATKLPHPLALDKLRRGEISALVYVATKPSRLLQDIRPDENLHFLPMTGNLPTYYTAITITSDDYPELVSKDAPVKTVEVGTTLVAYNWPTNSERYQRVNQFVRAFFAHVNDIQASHPKWHPFDITSSVSGWIRFSPAEQWLKKAGLTPEETRSTVVVHLDSKQREALFKDFQHEVLFREFAAYQRAHRQTMVAYRDDH